MNVAQLNIARIRFPLDSPELKDFVDGLPLINGLAERSPGFVWRLQDEAGDATHIETPWGKDILLNLTVWESVEALRDFIYHTQHLEYMRRRREWFDHVGLAAYVVLWHVPAGHIPTIEEAADRLEHLVKHGATEYAFTFREPARDRP